MAQYTLDHLKYDGSNDIWEITDSAARGSLAAAYSASSTYAVGDIVLKDGQLYKCNTAITTAEAWNAAHWTAVTVGENIADLGAETNQLKEDIGIITLSVIYKDGLYVDDGAFIGTRQNSQIALIDLTSITGNGDIRVKVSGNQNRARVLLTETNVADVASGTTGTYSDKNNALEFVVKYSEYRNYNTLAICTNFQSTPYASVYASTHASTGDDTIVDCWGDSLTQGAGATVSYPSKLQELIGSGKTVNNYGQGSETAEAIAFRQGGMSAMVGPFTTSTGYVELDPLISVDGMSLSTLNYSGLYNGNNVVTIDGTNFFYRRVSASKCKLARISGTDHTYTRPMLITAEGKGTKHIMIVCIGQNGWVNNSTETLAEIIKKMITHNDYDKYIVVGIPTGDTSTKSAQEQILGGIFGDHFVNAREYISTWGCTDNNITPTTADTEAMAIGAIPPSLRNDSVHLNDYGYIAMANCIYARGESLGYWN